MCDVNNVLGEKWNQPHEREHLGVGREPDQAQCFVSGEAFRDELGDELRGVAFLEEDAGEDPPVAVCHISRTPRA